MNRLFTSLALSVSLAVSALALALDKPTKLEPESLPEGAKVLSLVATPDKVVIGGALDYTQLVIDAKLDSGDVVDVTRIAELKAACHLTEVSETGMVRGTGNGDCKITVSLGGQQLSIPVKHSGFDKEFYPEWITDVNPVISRMGCNMGTCHGAKDGKNGFKLSLRGYDPLYDIRAFSDDIASRRVNLASPDDSLMLLKGTGAVPHEGGQRMTPISDYYKIVRAWISNGAKLNLDAPKAKSIEVFPVNPVVQKIGGMQQMRVLATYADGTKRDVTREAYVESGNTEVAEPVTGRPGLVTTIRRGEAPILVRYEGSYAATTVTAMGDRSGFVWKEPQHHSEIDKHVAAKLQRMRTLPSEICTDLEFVRRIYLDLTGLPPKVENVESFIADSRHSSVKRDALIDALIGSPEFIEYWTNKWRTCSR